MEEQEYLLLATMTVFIAFYGWPLLPEGNVVKGTHGGEGIGLWVCDAVGIGTFAVVGAQSALHLQMYPIIAAVCGLVTATFGGLMPGYLVRLAGESDNSVTLTTLSHPPLPRFCSRTLMGCLVPPPPFFCNF